MVKELPATKKYKKVREMYKQGYTAVQIGNELKMSTNWVHGVLKGKIGKGK